MKFTFICLCLICLACISFSLTVTAQKDDPSHTDVVQRWMNWRNSEMTTTKRPFSNICIWKICIKPLSYCSSKKKDIPGKQIEEKKLKYKSQMDQAMIRKTWIL